MNIVALDPNLHNRRSFDCGNVALNRFFQDVAAQQMRKDSARTYVLTDNENPSEILGFFTITLINLELGRLPSNLQKKYSSVQSAGLLARLAVNKTHQGKNLGRVLLHRALMKLYQASEIVGFPLIFVDYKDGKADFYQKFGFLPLPEINNRLYLPIATLRK